MKFFKITFLAFIFLFNQQKVHSNIEIDDLDSEVLKIDDDNISESKLLLILRLLERNIIEVNIK